MYAFLQWYYLTRNLLLTSYTHTGVKRNCQKSFVVLSVCSRTQVACWTTHCVKRWLFFSPLSFIHVLPDVTTSKLCEYSIFGNSGIVFKKFVVYFGKEISDFLLCCGFFITQKFKLIFRILNWLANESKTLSMSDQWLQGRMLSVSLWRETVEGGEGMI